MKIRHSVFLVIIFAAALSACQHRYELTPDDWPQYKYDNFRSGKSPVRLFDQPFGLKWVYTAAQVPVPAWYGPAREDAFANSGPLPSMRDYDLAYSPVIIDEKLYYGSTSDDALHCLNARTGKEIWAYITDGPVRIAPTWYGGNIYFGSDDGYIYCLDAVSGKLKWKFSPSGSPEKILNNGRLISFWPVRTGVLIEEGIAYFGASLLPWKKSYLCAVDAGTGKTGGKRTYVREVEDVTFEGSMASSGDRLIQPQGRVSPVFIDKATGEIQGQLPGSGGCFVLVTPDQHIVHPQTSRYISIVDLEPDDREKPEYMSFKGGKEMVVSGDTSYVLSDHALSAYNRKTREVIWVNRNYYAHRIIMAGNILFAGATDTVYAISTADGHPLWQGHVEGTVYALAAADSALFASTGEGKIYCFSKDGSAGPAPVRGERDEDYPVECENPEAGATVLELKSGPYITAKSNKSVVLEFETELQDSCAVCWHANNHIEQAVYKAGGKHIKHRFVIPVRKDFIYKYRVISRDRATKEYEYDNFFNYSVNSISFPAGWFRDREITEYADALISKMDPGKGLCLVLGLHKGQLPMELAQKTDMDIVVLDLSQQDVNKFRKRLLQQGVYGVRISAYRVKDFERFPLQSDLADLVVCTGEQPNLDEVIRLTAPDGKAIYRMGRDAGDLSDQYDRDAENSNEEWKARKEIVRLGPDFAIVLTKQEPESNGVWTHQYGSPDNSAFGGERSLWGSTSSDEFEVQWMGRPGPRFQSDRSGRKPSPLAVNGKIFVQGKERIAAINAYNGTIIWSREIPGVLRMNIHRDCSNWAADHRFIYIARKGKLLVIDQQDGTLHDEISVPDSRSGLDWGYVGPVDGLLVGTENPPNSSYTDYYGNYGWYDAATGPSSDKVMSLSIFAVSPDDGTLKWKYGEKGAMIINPTITIFDRHVFFVESGSTAGLREKGRGGKGIFNKLFLVSLNVKDGSVEWRKRIENEAGVAAYYMAAGSGRLIIVSSNNGKFYLYNYDAKDGSLVWQKSIRWGRNHHGGHLSRPAIVGNRLMVKPYLFRMDTGEKLDYRVSDAGHGCASYALSEQSVFYRGGSVAQYNFDTHKYSKWERLRPDCWISTVPALGMVLSPEGGGGCSCGNWYETSMVMAPKSRAPVMFKFEGDGKFIDTLSVRLVLKKGVEGTLHFTADGSVPGKDSPSYEKPILINRNTEIRVALIYRKDGKERKALKSRFFERLRPAPEIIPGKSLAGGKRKVVLQRRGNTGIIHYTTDERPPDENSAIYENPLEIGKKTNIKAVVVWEEQGKRKYTSGVAGLVVDAPVALKAIKTEARPGLEEKYYEGIWMKVPVFDTLKAAGEKIVSSISVGSSSFGRPDNYGLRFNGFIKIPEDGLYTFYTASRDGSILYIDDRKVVDNDGSHDLRERSGVIALESGLHSFRLDYFQDSGHGALYVKWEGPGIRKVSLPEDVFFH